MVWRHWLALQKRHQANNVGLAIGKLVLKIELTIKRGHAAWRNVGAMQLRQVSEEINAADRDLVGSRAVLATAEARWPETAFENV